MWDYIEVYLCGAFIAVALLCTAIIALQDKDALLASLQ
jgi:hypothetical protein